MAMPSRGLGFAVFMSVACCLVRWSAAIRPEGSGSSAPVRLLGARGSSERVMTEICAVPPEQHVLFTETCATYQHLKKNDISITAMQQEYESAQILLRASSPVRVRVESTVSFALRWYQVGFVKVSANKRVGGSGGGWRPDPLMEVAPGESILVPEGFTQPLWLTWHMDTTGLGEKGEVIVYVNDKVAHRIPLAVDVRPVAVPDVFNAKVKQLWGFVEQHLEPLYGKPVPVDIVKQFKELLYKHRIPVPAEADDFRNHRQPIMKIGLPYVGEDEAMMTGVGHNTGSFPACREGAKLDPVLLKAAVAKTKKRVDELLLEGWPFVYGYGKDEPDPKCAGLLRESYAAFQEIPKLRVIAATNWEPELLPVDYPMDTLVQLYSKYEEGAATKWTAAPGKELWGYHCIEPSGEEYLNLFIERPLIHARLLFWLAAARRYDGWLYWVDDLWRACPEASPSDGSSPTKHFIRPLNNTHPALMDFEPASYVWCPEITDIFANGDGYYMYPGEHGPVTTQRLDQIRDGLEDLELLRMLPHASIAEITQQLVRGPTDWTDDAALLRSVRTKALDKVVASQRPLEPHHLPAGQVQEVNDTKAVHNAMEKPASHSRSTVKVDTVRARALPVSGTKPGLARQPKAMKKAVEDRNDGIAKVVAQAHSAEEKRAPPSSTLKVESARAAPFVEEREVAVTRGQARAVPVSGTKPGLARQAKAMKKAVEDRNDGIAKAGAQAHSAEEKRAPPSSTVKVESARAAPFVEERELAVTKGEVVVLACALVVFGNAALCFWSTMSGK